MSERALAFVEAWTSDNIQPQDAPPQDADAKAYAAQCILAAGQAGIPELEIREAIEDLTAFMAAAITETNEQGHGDAADDAMIADADADDDTAEPDGETPGRN
jgi:hypothetical protein